MLVKASHYNTLAATRKVCFSHALDPDAQGSASCLLLFCARLASTGTPRFNRLHCVQTERDEAVITFLHRALFLPPPRLSECQARGKHKCFRAFLKAVRCTG